MQYLINSQQNHFLPVPQHLLSGNIPELGEMAMTADLDWTMEAIMNVMKNCMEHNTGGTVHCSYGQNPLYTEILIWDEGLQQSWY